MNDVETLQPTDAVETDLAEIQYRLAELQLAFSGGGLGVVTIA